MSDLAGQKKDFYQKMRARIKDWLQKNGRTHKWSEYVMMAPDFFHLLCKLSLKKEVSSAGKAKLAFAIAYFISPFDLIPEGIVGPAGYLDDIALAAYVLNSIVSQTDPEVVRSCWAGEEDILELVERILDVSDDMLGTGLWKRLKKLLGGKKLQSKSKGI
jgi:uncharacterized membrane protein YkvA (DUF1232 family)